MSLRFGASPGRRLAIEADIEVGMRVLRITKSGCGIFGAIAFAWLGATAAQAASITGVCPDGSIYIVQRAESIPCRDSKRVEPSEVPPLKPEMLPRPYGWEVFHRRNDPNNPYNLVDTGRAVRGTPPPSGERTANPAPPTPGTSATAESGAGFQTARRAEPLPPVSSAPPTSLNLGLDPEELRDLALIVEYSQERAPATLVRGDALGDPDLVVRISVSRAFEARLHETAQRQGRLIRGPVVLFTAQARRDAEFHGNLTFVQGHMAFHPDATRIEEFGVIDGELGNLRPDAGVLGYVVLPEWAELGEPLDIYWNDRQLTATLRP